MVRAIIRDPILLSMKAAEATDQDLSDARDLMDTLKANAEVCIGMAGNMIGVNKRMIAVGGMVRFLMLNPRIRAKHSPYHTVESCLSLEGEREAIRYQEIEVEYQDMHFQKHRQTFHGLTAQIIQHEMDHLDGILI